MSKSSFYALLLAVALCVVACGGRQNRANQVLPEKSNSRDALDWNGTYSGTVPCADCPGIHVELTLSSDLTYTMTRVYQDRDGMFVNSGNFDWNDAGSGIKLHTASDDGSFQHFKVNEGALVLLTPSGEIVTGVNADAYLLYKSESDATDVSITNKYWKLTELNGHPVNYPDNSRAAFILMHSDGTVSGNLGCNSFAGSYTLQEGNRISFSQLLNTQMLCMDMSIETEMTQILQITDNYNLNDKQLILNRARMSPLARFEQVFLKKE
jgi:heat shock protein HslJ